MSSEDADFEEDVSSEAEADTNPRPSKRAKKSKSARIFDLEASASEDDESDVGHSFDEDDAAFMENNPEDADLSVDAADYRRVENALQQRGTAEVERIAAQIEERHQQYAIDNDVEEGDFEQTGISQQARQPTFKDPKLFSVKTKPGFERSIVSALMMKYLTLKAKRETPAVYSVTSMDHLKGVVYVEAYKEVEVKNFVRFINGVFSSKVSQVELSDMVSVVTVPKKKAPVKVGDWVRLKRGTYKNDLAQVYEFDPSNDTAWVRLIPRLDLVAWAKKMERAEGDIKRPRATGHRPAQKRFSAQEINEKYREGYVERIRDLQSSSRDLFFKFDNQMFKDGFLHKKVKLVSLYIDGIAPTLEEIQTFQSGDLDNVEEDVSKEVKALKNAKRIVATTKKRFVQYAKNDAVIVVDGPLSNLEGIVHDIEGDGERILIQTDSKSVGIVPVERIYVRKLFRIGDHVKVESGEGNSQSGMIVQLNNNIATILTDVARTELKVQTNDLQKTKEISTGLTFREFSLLDLVMLNSSEVGVIVRIENSTALILDANNATQRKPLQGVTKKRDGRRVVGKDIDSTNVSRGDQVEVIMDGAYKGVKGKILHIHRLNCFLQTQHRSENAGVVVVPTKQMRRIGTSMNQVIHGKKERDGQRKSRYNTLSRGGGNRNDPLLNATVSIKTGPYKGYYGTVKDAMDEFVTIELLTNARRIQVSRSDFMSLQKDNHDDEPIEELDDDYSGSKTPMRGNQTPRRFRTPAHPSQGDSYGTPARTPMAETPQNYDADASFTQFDARGSNYNPYNTATAQTPATPSAMANTPSSSYPPTGATPYATPGSYYNPATPHTPNYTAPTPGTPGAYAAQTTTPYLAAATPRTPGLGGGYGATAATPGTPGMGGGYGAAATPGTPGMGGGYGSAATPSTPGYGYHAHTPASNPYTIPSNAPGATPVPNTPRTPGYQPPSNPYSAPSSSSMMHPPPSQSVASKWLPQVMVSYQDRTAVVTEVLAMGEVAIAFVTPSAPHTRTGETLRVPGDSLIAVPPSKKNDVAMVIGGDSRYHETGNVIAVEDGEAIMVFKNGEMQLEADPEFFSIGLVAKVLG